MENKLKHILLIDDDDDNNLIHKLIIEDTGMNVQVKAVLSVKEALHYLESGEKPELIFLDINMPLLNGWDFLEEYKNLHPENKENSVIVLLTSSVNMNDENKALSFKEVAAYKNKPLTVDLLQEIFQKHFNF